MRRAFLRGVARLTAGAPILVLAACVFLALLAGLHARHLLGFSAEGWSHPIQTDLLALLPESSPEAQTFLRSIERFESFDYLLVVIEADRPHREEALIRVAKAFAAPIRDYYKYVQSIEYAPPLEDVEAPPPEGEPTVIPALLTEAELARLEWALRMELGERFDLLRHRLIKHVAPARRDALLADPLDLRGLFHRDQIRFIGPVPGPLRNGLLLSEDGQMLLMVVRPREPATDLLRTEELMRWLRKLAVYALGAAGPDAEGIEIGFIGSHAEAENDAATVRHDLALTLIASFLLVTLLFILVVGRITAMLLVGLPLAIGFVWTLGIASFFYDQISVVTCVFGVALIGLGIDYAIHLHNRYVEERLAGGSITGALEIALVETGQGIFMGAVTTTMAFFGLCLTRFEGLQELGIVGGIGNLCCLAATFFVLPPLILLSEQVPGRWVIPRARTDLGLGRLAASVQNYPRLTMMVGLIVTAYLGAFARQIRFEPSVRELREPPAHYDDLVRRAENRFELPSSQAIAIVSAPTSETAFLLNDMLYERLVNKRQIYPILGFDSLRTVWPAMITQQAAMERLRAILEPPDGNLEERIRREVRNRNFDLGVARTVLEQIARWKERLGPAYTVELNPQSSAAFVDRVRRHIHQHEGRFYIATHIYPRQDGWLALQDRFIADLKKEDPGIEITGLSVVAGALKRLLIRGMGWAVLVVSLSVFLLLVLHFRGVRKALVAMVPVLCGIVWTLGTMQILGMQLNFLNAIVIPLILGLGIDDGIHILQRYYEGGRHDIESAVESTGRAVVFTSLTTMLTFGTLFFATFRGRHGRGVRPDRLALPRAGAPDARRRAVAPAGPGRRRSGAGSGAG